MNWIRENKKLASILISFGVVALGLGAWLYLAYSNFSKARGDYDVEAAAVNNLRGASLSPSQENVDEKSAKVKEYEAQVDNLRDVLLSHQTAPAPMAENDFQAKLKQRITSVKADASRAQVDLPSTEFALGFDEYTASLPKTPQVAGELSLHLDVANFIVGTLINAGIRRLDTFERAKLPSESKNPAQAAPVHNALHPGPANNRGRMAAAAAPAAPSVEYYPIKLTMTCDQAPLQLLLNKLADPNPKIMPYFMIVRQVRIENEKSEAPLKDEIKSKLQNVGSLEAAGGTTKPAVGNGAVPAKPDAVTVMGQELLHVYLELDYVRFATPVAAAGPTK